MVRAKEYSILGKASSQRILVNLLALRCHTRCSELRVDDAAKRTFSVLNVNVITVHDSTFVQGLIIQVL